MSIFHSNPAKSLTIYDLEATVLSMLLPPDKYKMYFLSRLSVEHFEVTEFREVMKYIHQILCKGDIPQRVDANLVLKQHSNSELPEPPDLSPELITPYFDELTERHASRMMDQIFNEWRTKVEMGHSVLELRSNLYGLLNELRPFNQRIPSMAGLTAMYSKEFGTYLSRKIHLKTGMMELDRETGGLHPGGLTIIGSRPGVGKTALMLGWISRICVFDQIPGLIFSIDLGEETLMHRLYRVVKFHSEIQLGESHDHQNSSHQIAMEKMSRAPLFLDDGTTDLDAVVHRIYELKASADIKVVFIDFIQHLKISRFKRSRDEELSGILRKLKSVARECGIALVVTSQLSRSLETRGGDKRPQLSDLRESGSLEQEGDLVLLIYRPELYGITHDVIGDQLPENFAGLILAKNRYGEIWDVPLEFNRRAQVFQPYQLADFSTGFNVPFSGDKDIDMPF